MRLVLKKKKRGKTFSLIIILIVISIIFSILLIKFYSDRVTPVITSYSEDEIKRLMLLVINNAIGEGNNEFDYNNLFTPRYNSNGEIILIDFDSKKSSLVLSNITNYIEYNLRDIEEGKVDKFKDYYSDYNFNLLKRGIVVEVPFGASFNNSFLNNFGPKIPVRISFTRNVVTGFSTEVVEYGMNNALLKLNINISINIRVILPIVSNDMNTSFTIPIAMKVIQGKIPSYYMDGFTTNSNVVKED